MGVTDLWKILDKANVGLDSDSLSLLRDKKVAVDLSGWILQSSQVQYGQFTISNLHLRNLFWRVFHLLKHQVTPVFVTEGQPPCLKRPELDKRQQYRARATQRESKASAESSSSYDIHQQECSNKSSSGVKHRFQRLTEECCKLLELLGISCIQAKGEAEATCAWLNQQRIVDGVITDDSDTFLFGGETVYRNFSCAENKFQPSYTSYSTDDVIRTLGTERSDLVGLALLLGSDYCSGVRSIGMEKVLKLLAEIRGREESLNLLQRFTDWKVKCAHYEELESYNSERQPIHCRVCKHPGSKVQHRQNGCDRCFTENNCKPIGRSQKGSKGPVCSCEYHLNLMKYLLVEQELKIRKEALKDPSFPSTEVIDAYLMVDSSVIKPEMIWKKPDFEKLKDFLTERLHWKEEAIQRQVSQLMTTYEMYSMLTSSFLPEIVHQPSALIPHRVIKEATRKFVPVYHVEWRNTNDTSETSVTVEVADTFRKSFPDIVAAYEMAQDKKKSEKLQKQKDKKKSEKLQKQKSKGKGRKRRSLSSNNEQKQPKINQFFASKKFSSNERVESVTKQGSEDTLAVETVTKQGSEDTLAVETVTKQGSEDTLAVETVTKQGSEDTLAVETVTKQGSEDTLEVETVTKNEGSDCVYSDSSNDERHSALAFTSKNQDQIHIGSDVPYSVTKSSQNHTEVVDLVTKTSQGNVEVSDIVVTTIQSCTDLRNTTVCSSIKIGHTKICSFEENGTRTRCSSLEMGTSEDSSSSLVVLPSLEDILKTVPKVDQSSEPEVNSLWNMTSAAINEYENDDLVIIDSGLGQPQSAAGVKRKYVCVTPECGDAASLGTALKNGTDNSSDGSRNNGDERSSDYGNSDDDLASSLFSRETRKRCCVSHVLTSDSQIMANETTQKPTSARDSDRDKAVTAHVNTVDSDAESYQDVFENTNEYCTGHSEKSSQEDIIVRRPKLESVTHEPSHGQGAQRKAARTLSNEENQVYRSQHSLETCHMNPYETPVKEPVQFSQIRRTHVETGNIASEDISDRTVDFLKARSVQNHVTRALVISGSSSDSEMECDELPDL